MHNSFFTENIALVGRDYVKNIQVIWYSFLTEADYSLRKEKRAEISAFFNSCDVEKAEKSIIISLTKQF